MPALLADEGDDLEKESWPDLKQYFPHYEVFWQLHVYPLRSSGIVYLRKELDEDLERMAILHFSTYVSLSRGFSKIKNRSEDFKYFEEIYANLFCASELAGETVCQFCLICGKCLKNEIAIHTEKLVKVSTQLKVYRNLIHGNILATIRDSNRRRLIPKAGLPDDLGGGETTTGHQCSANRPALAGEEGGAETAYLRTHQARFAVEAPHSGED